jgi:pimeloyl-ACP methyl ester carboxylesterase
MRELDNGAVLEAIEVPSLIIQGKDDRIFLSASSDNSLARRLRSLWTRSLCGGRGRVQPGRGCIYAARSRLIARPPADTSGGLLPARTAGRNFFEIAL